MRRAPLLVLGFAGAAGLINLPLHAGEKAAVGSRSGGGGTEAIYLVDLATGVAGGWEVRSGGSRLDAVTIQQNLFEAIGRPVGNPAPRGSVFLFSINKNGGSTEALAILEADSGYVGFLNRVGKDRKVGALLGAVGRPALGAAAADGLHAVVPAIASNGSSRGFYVVHGATGACVFLSNFDPERGSADGSGCSAMPVSGGGWASVPLRSEAPSFVLMDATTGATFVVRSSGTPTELIASQINLDLAGSLGAPDPASPLRRFSAAEVWTAGGNAMVVADAQTGRLVLVTGLDTTAVRVTPIAATFDRSTGVGDARALLVPVYGGEASTTGVLVFDATGTPQLLISELESGSPRVQNVEIRR